MSKKTNTNNTQPTPKYTTKTPGGLIISHIDPKDLEKNKRKTPIQKVCKTVKKGSKKVVKTTGKVVRNGVAIVTLPAVLVYGACVVAGLDYIREHDWDC